MDKFRDLIRDAKSGYKVSYSFTNCDGVISKTIKFDSCATNISDYPQGSRKIKDIEITDSVVDQLKYVNDSGVIIYLSSSDSNIEYKNPTETNSNGLRTLTYDAKDIAENETIVIKFNLEGSTEDYESATGTENIATTQFKIDNDPYMFRDAVKFKLYCECPLNPQCSGVSENNPDCAQDEQICLKDATGNTKYGYRDVFGKCKEKPGCYCVNDPWIWITDPSDSIPVCECVAGKNMWDDTDSKCCSKQECFISSDRTWVCDNGIRKDGSFLCERMSACGRDWYWNGTFWSDKMDDGCNCDISERCASGVCIAGKCLTVKKPDISFQLKSKSVELGSKTQTIIYVKNSLAVRDTIRLNVYASTEKFGYWINFENDQDYIDVTLEGNETRAVVLNVFAGQTGTYKMTIIADSELSPGISAMTEQQIQIIHLEKEISTNTPDIQWLAVFIIVFIAIVVASGRYSKKDVPAKKSKH